MLIKKLSEIKLGENQEIVVLAQNIDTERSKTGELYQRIIVRDEEGSESSFFKFDNLINFATPVVIKARIESSAYKDSKTTKILSCEQVQMNMNTFFPKSVIDERKCWGEILTDIKAIRPSLSIPVCAVIKKNAKKFQTLPLNNSGAFSRFRGVMEATWKLMQMAKNAADLLDLDKDLLIAASALYYIGKVDTIDEAYNCTKDDVLYGMSIKAYGHILLAINEIISGNDENQKSALDQTDTDLLCHTIVSRNRGVKTAIAEAMVLQHLSSMIEESDEIKCLLKDADKEAFINMSYNKKIYNPAKPVEEKVA